MKTAVLQIYRAEKIPAWIARCMDSVRDWAASRGYDYDFGGDEVFALCGEDFLRAVGENMRSITNLARLEWIRASLAAGYERAIWLDADVFIFDPARFELDIETGYAFGLEVWITLGWGGPWIGGNNVHNAAVVFAGHHRDLDLMIDTIRYIAATRPVLESWQIGTNLLNGLQNGLQFPLLPGAGMFSPDLIRAIAGRRTRLLRLFARETNHPVYAANMSAAPGIKDYDHDMMKAMDILETTHGDVINRYLDRAAPAPLTVLPPASLKTRPLFSLWFPVLIIRRLLPKRFGGWLRRLKAGRSPRLECDRFRPLILSGRGHESPSAKNLEHDCT
jgi:hypothetical protein